MTLLNIKPAHFDVPIYNDAGSGARLDLTTWKPRLDSGWFYLGPAANNGDGAGSWGVVVQPASDKRVLAPITDWELVWNDAGSGKLTDFALWRGLPAIEDRVDFIVVGGFFVRSHQKPTAQDAQGMRAIHRDVLVAANHGAEIWTDKGSGARKDGAVWGISTDGNLGAVNTGTFVPVEGYNNPPHNAYALNKNTVHVLES